MDSTTIDPRRRMLLTMAIMVATTMQVLDTTIANVALPHMQGSLSVTQDQISWVLTSYIVASAIFTPPIGFIAGRIGRRNLMLWSIVGFVITSMLCGISENLTEMVFFRLLQGVCGASLVPLSQAIILDIYPKEKHGQAMAIWGLGIMVGPILGPTIGGYLTEYMNWRWVFFINMPIGIIGFMGIAALLPEGGRDKERPFDMLGFTLLSVGVAALQLMLDRGQTRDWFQSPEILIEAILSVIALYFFVVHMLTAKHPFIERGLFADRNFLIGTGLIFMVGVLLLSTAALMPPFIENILGFPVATTGLVMAPRGVGTMAAMFVVGRLIGRTDERYLLLFGIILMAFSLWEISFFTADVGAWPLIKTGLIQGFSMGFVFIPLTTIAYATLPAQLRTEAAGFFGLMRNIGSSIGVSVAFAVLARQIQINHSELVEHVNPYNPLFQPFAVFDGASAQFSTQGLAMIDGEINRQATIIGFLDDMLLMMCAALAMLPALLLLRKPEKHLPPPDQAWE
jgi:DHA2 family multidrug resistance protein